MDTLNNYREIIEQLLTKISGYSRSSDTCEYRTLFDRKSDSYLFLRIGWEKNQRIHHAIIHLEIINGKVWIQENNTDLPIADDLEEAGIPKTDIVLGFQHPSVRQYTDYAAA
jgi:XisI protein